MSKRRIWSAVLAMAFLVLGIPFAASAAISVTYQYDSQGRVSQAVYVNGATTRTVTYTYDAAGNWSSVISQ